MHPLKKGGGYSRGLSGDFPHLKKNEDFLIDFLCALCDDGLVSPLSELLSKKVFAGKPCIHSTI